MKNLGVCDLRSDWLADRVDVVPTAYAGAAFVSLRRKCLKMFLEDVGIFIQRPAPVATRTNGALRL